MAKYLTECVGTFFLVLTIGCTVVGGGAGVIPPLAIGAVLMVMVYAGGHVSGGHYNPAVGVALPMMGLAAWSLLPIYLPAHLLAGAIAAAVFRFANPDDR